MSAVRFRLTFGAFRRIILYKKKNAFLSILSVLSAPSYVNTARSNATKKHQTEEKNDLQTEICA